MKQIRHGVFETNSSSTHSLTICSKSEYERWGEDLWFDSDNEEFFPAGWTDEMIAKTKQDYEEDRINDRWGHGSDTPWDELSNEEREDLLEIYYDSVYKTPNHWSERNDSLEEFEHFYTSPSGDEIVIFGRYGYDG